MSVLKGRPDAAIAALFAGHEADFARRLRQIDSYADDFGRFGGEPPAPRFAQDWFPRLDAAVAYMMVRQLRPRRILEVGSGHSTRIMARAIADGALTTRLTAVDPAPRAPLSGLPVVHVRSKLQDADPALLETIVAGDLLFVDSSHVLRPGTDVDLLIGHVLPALPEGAIVHFHDVFLPDGYPPSWARRAYNEQDFLAPALLAGGWRPLFASHYVVTRMTALLALSIVSRLPLLAGAFESSLWLEKRR